MLKRSRAEAERPDAREIGRLGEARAAEFMARLGYRVLERNLRCRYGEVDLLLLKGPLLVAAEVKTRRHHPAPEQTVSSRQQRRLERCLLAMARVLRPRPKRLRVDVLAVRLLDADTMEVLHFPGTEFLPQEAAQNW